MIKKIFSITIIACLGISICVSASQVEAKKESSSVKVEEVKTSNTISTTKNVVSDKKNVESTVKKTTENKTTTKKETESKSTTSTKKDTTKSSSEKKTSEIKADGKVDVNDFVVIVNNIEIKFGEDMNQFTNDLGDPDDFTQARSCLHDGDDKIYVYGDVTLYTYPNGKKDILYIAEYTGETKTKSGIKIGSTKEEVIKAYGNNYVEDNVYLTYTFEEYSTISFQFENGKVTYIELFKEN